MIQSIIHKLEILRLKPFNTSTEEGRSNERYRRIALTALVSAVAKLITIITSFITVPLTLNYLGAERYGLWMTISSVIAMMVFADFGIGNGLMNAISEAFGKDDKNAIKSHIANASIILSCIALIILGIFFIMYPFISWGTFFNVKSQIAIAEAGPALAAFTICFALGVPAAIVQRVQMALQQGFASSMWQAGGSILGLLLTLAVIFSKGGLPWLVLALGGAPVIMLSINTVIFFFFQRSDLLPVFNVISKSGIVKILHGGVLFFVLQLAISVAFASDNIIIAKVINAEAVSQYSVVSKLFEGVVMVIGLAFGALWPAYAEAKARNDLLWIKKTLIRSMSITFIIATSASLILFIFHKQIFSLWVGSKYSISFILVACYAIWTVLKSLGSTYAMFLNGMNILKLQIILSIIFMGVSIILKYIFIKKFGLAGIVVGTSISYLLVTILPCTLLTNRLLRSSVN